jgi:hypothetical protein
MVWILLRQPQLGLVSNIAEKDAENENKIKFIVEIGEGKYDESSTTMRSPTSLKNKRTLKQKRKTGHSPKFLNS